jgi:carbohydrate-selective porin OprB
LFPGLAAAQYSLSYFDTPSIPTQASSRNWSLNAVQNLDKTWAVFGRANTVSGATNPIKASYAAGVAMNNPLRRAATDQVAVAVGYSVVAALPVNPAGARDEKIIEAYWSWTFVGGLLVTPAVQVTFDPALNAGTTSVTVLSVRTTLMF